MGKTTPKTVRLTESELRDLCQRAVEDGVSKYISAEKEKKKKGVERPPVPYKEAPGELHEVKRLCRTGGIYPRSCRRSG